jgi:hypothetical protein
MYLAGTQHLPLILQPQNLSLKCYIDAAYGVHSDGKSQSGMVLTVGDSFVLGKSCKQKIVTKSSTEAELVAQSDMLPTALWLLYFIQAQGYNINHVVSFEDNQSTIKLITNNTASSNRTKHIKIRYFWIKDKIDSGDVILKYKKTEEMIADLMTKALVGSQFAYLRRLLMGESSV